MYVYISQKIIQYIVLNIYTHIRNYCTDNILYVRTHIYIYTHYIIQQLILYIYIYIKLI